MAAHKGVLLAGGTGTRFRPLTQAVNKHLFPVYDKPMIYYSLSALMLMQMQDILLITGPESLDAFKSLLGDGSRFGVNLTFAIQDKPAGLPDGLAIAEDFLNGSPSVLTLGDNVFHGHGLSQILQSGLTQSSGSAVFLYEVPDAREFGVAELSPEGRVIGLEEKPSAPKSNWAVTGLYVFDAEAPSIAKSLTPSARSELEIVDLLRAYLERNALTSVRLDRGVAWMDMGTPESLVNASEYFRHIDRRQRRKVAVLEEIAWRNGWIDEAALRAAADLYANSDYGAYLTELTA